MNESKIGQGGGDCLFEGDIRRRFSLTTTLSIYKNINYNCCLLQRYSDRQISNCKVERETIHKPLNTPAIFVTFRLIVDVMIRFNERFVRTTNRED